jgi:hypothetical protein
MTEKYAELKLYYGLCQSDGCGEGRFLPDRKDNWSANRFNRAMQTVTRYLQPDYEWGLHFGSWEHIVRSEVEAKTLIQFAEQNIQGASGLVELVDSMHGKIAFWRKIHFTGWTKYQQEELLQELKKSGYNPVDEHKERLERDLKPENSELNRHWNQLIQEELKRLNPDKPWKQALKFF